MRTKAPAPVRLLILLLAGFAYVAGVGEEDPQRESQSTGVRSSRKKSSAKPVKRPKRKTSTAEPDISSTSERIFTMFDKDRDGLLSRTELEEMFDWGHQSDPDTPKGGSSAGAFPKLDKNGDGGVDREEAAFFFNQAADDAPARPRQINLEIPRTSKEGRVKLEL